MSSTLEPRSLRDYYIIHVKSRVKWAKEKEVNHQKFISSHAIYCYLHSFVCLILAIELNEARIQSKIGDAWKLYIC